jgi:sulfide:quinone oxidoreductase
MSGFRVVIAGGGIAAVEALLRLNRLAGDELEVTMLAPAKELRYRPLAVQEPFAAPGARRYPLSSIALANGADLVADSVEWLDADGQVVHTAGGQKLRYDALLLAYGARSVPASDDAITFDDANADETFLGIVRGIEGGYMTAVDLVVPEGPVWSLPVYELALQTADRAYESGFDDVAITVITPERGPLEVFGEAVSSAVRNVLADARVGFRTGSPRSSRAQTVVALPRIEGRAIRGVPGDAGGFVPIDSRCRVAGLGEHVFAAGDATDFPVKQGGIGAQQADVAAAGIASLAGARHDVAFEPVLRGSLIAGGRRHLYFQARWADGRAAGSEVLDEPAWAAADKVVAAELGPYLRTLDAAAA